VHSTVDRGTVSRRAPVSYISSAQTTRLKSLLHRGLGRAGGGGRRELEQRGMTVACEAAVCRERTGIRRKHTPSSPQGALIFSYVERVTWIQRYHAPRKRIRNIAGGAGASLNLSVPNLTKKPSAEGFLVKFGSREAARVSRPPGLHLIALPFLSLCAYPVLRWAQQRTKYRIRRVVAARAARV
jgi:hypothetical protein